MIDKIMTYDDHNYTDKINEIIESVNELKENDIKSKQLTEIPDYLIQWLLNNTKYSFESDNITAEYSRQLLQFLRTNK